MCIKSETEFSIKILKTINSKVSAVYSPFSILNNLAIIFAGCDEKTAEQLSTFLGYGKSKDEIIQHYSSLMKYCKNENATESFELLSSNCLFVSDEPMLLSFTEIMDKFSAEYHNINFKEAEKSAREINQFISQNTNGQIKNIVEESDIIRNANLFVVNAMYFSGKFEKPFEEVQGFFGEQKTQMLKRTIKNEGFNLVENEKWQCLGIPFKDQKCWLHILLPREGQSNLNELLENFDPDVFQQCVTKKEVSKVEVVIPKFLLETKIPLDETLKTIGVTEIFEFGSIRKIFADPHYVDKAIHFTKFEINKYGVKAASTSVMRVVPVSAIVDLEMKYFYATDPFIYFITLTNNGPSDVKNILLMGQYCGDELREEIMC